MQNYRYDEFLDVLQPVLMQETIKVPATAPYYVPLLELPLETVPSSVLVRDSAATTTVNPDQDCSVLQLTGLNNDDPTLYCGRSASGGGGYLSRAFVRFNIAALPSSPSKVLLRLYQGSISGDSLTQTIGVYQLTSSWTETGPTWASQPTFNTTPYGSIAIAPPVDDGKGGAGGYSGWVECDITALYNAWKAGTNYGLMLRADETIYSTVNIISSEGGVNAPQLVVINSGALYTQVGQTVAPSAKEFACAYSSGKLRFNSAAAGLTLNVDYQGLGSPVDAMDVGLRGVTTGTSTAYLYSTPNLVQLTTNMLLWIYFHANSGTNPTLNVNSLGAKSLYKQSNATQIASGNLLTGQMYPVYYDGVSKFFVIGV